jgi:regulator of cell morphogenesis and NO signaling
MFIMRALQFSEISDIFTTADTRKSELVPVGKLKSSAWQKFDNWDLDNLTDYITTIHHNYIRQNTVVIYDLIQAVAHRHGEHQPQLLKFTEVAFLFFHDLLNLLAKEEQLLFPIIKQLLQSRKYKEAHTNMSFKFLKDSVMLMQQEQLNVEKDLKMFHKLIQDYMLPTDTYNSAYKFLFEKIKEFEYGLALYVDMKNFIVFPNVLALIEGYVNEEKYIRSWQPFPVLKHSIK